jgi:gluconate 2-dehydrogenase gamma chain
MGAVPVDASKILPVDASRVVAGARQVAEVPARAALTAPEMSTLSAVLEQLLPSDALGPGAVEAGVPAYIERALAGSYANLLPVYQLLLPMFNKAAASLGASSFADLSASDQIALLVEFEGGTPPGIPASEGAVAAGGFQLLLAHMREGMFGDPMYGGNRRLAGWTLIGYPGIQLQPSDANQQIGTVVKPTGETATSLGGVPYNGPYADA